MAEAPPSLPGGVDARAVEVALELLAPLGARAVAGGALGALTTYRVGGDAAVLVTVCREEELAVVAAAASASGLPTLVVGRGSNLLVSDRGFGGIALILDTEAFGFVEVDGTTVNAGAAVSLPTLARRSVEAGLTGFEWAVGVPGSVGGAVRMNAGGHGGDIAGVMSRCRLSDLASGAVVRTVEVEDLSFGYRSSAIRPWEVVLAAELKLSVGDRERGLAEIREIVRWRREHQPGGQNAGSVFTNPESASAGWLVEAAGQKGRREGTAMVSPKHANFIQADSGGSADDVARLIELVREEIHRSQGVRLSTEVRMVGFHNHEEVRSAASD